MNDFSLKNLSWVDRGRGIAILLVIAVHTGQFYPNTLIYFYTSFGKMGVQMFFILSSFTLFNSFDSRINTEKYPIKSFYIRRFFRIAPLYYLMTFFYCIISNNKINFIYLLSNILFLNQIYLPAHNYIPPGGWSIGTEMLFYLFVPFLYFNINSYKKSILYLAISLLIALTINLLLFKGMKFLLHRQYYVWDTISFNNLPVFFMGILLYFVIKEKKNTGNKYIYILSSIFLFFIFSKYPFSNTNNNIFVLPFGLLNYTQFFSFVIMLFYFGFSKLSFNKSYFLEKVGKYSFSIYLVHFFVMDFIFYWFKNLLNKSNLNFLPFFLATVLISFLISQLTFFIEKRGIDFGKKIINLNRQ